MSKSSEEYRSILRATAVLETSVKNNITPLCGQLVAENLITPEQSKALRKRSIDEVERAADLVSYITTKVQTDPQNYHRLVKVLKKDEATYKPVLEVLDAEPTRGAFAIYKCIIEFRQVAT